jgi:hypothetical protein
LSVSIGQAHDRQLFGSEYFVLTACFALVPARIRFNSKLVAAACKAKAFTVLTGGDNIINVLNE